MAQIELTVPDLGGFSDIPVIEVLVHPGDAVEKETPLVTLESDKATMEVPASAGGIVKDIRVKVGDKVSQGSVLVTVDAADASVTTPAPTATPSASPAPSAAAAPSSDPIGAVAADAGASEESTGHAAPSSAP